MIHYKLLSLLMLFFLSCSSPEKSDYNSIKVEIDDRTPVSVFDLFEKIEIIPLETSSSSLFHFARKVICHDNVLYIHNYESREILAFDIDGKYLLKISNMGQGPNEYRHISDFTIDKYTNRILIVDPISNNLLEFDLNGKFLSKIKLPAITGAYSKLTCLNNNIIAFWTYDYSNRLKIFDRNDNNIFNEYFPREVHSVLDHFEISPFNYNNYIIAESAIDNNIYSISSEGNLLIDYTWDFEKLNNPINLAEELPERELNTAESRSLLINQMRSSEIVNYYFSNIGGNCKYRYAQIIRKGKVVNIMNEISENKTMIFEKTIENATFHPFWWDDSFVIGYGPYSGIETLEETLPDIILDEENLTKKKQIKNDDNQVFIKYYFK